MASETEICNLALSHLGIGKEIANLDTEKSQEAAACRQFYDIARDETLRDFNWPFAKKYQVLALVEADPISEWSFSYRYPTDALKVRKILSGTRNDDRQSKIPYCMGQDSSGQLLYTDESDAQIEYTVKSNDPAIYPPDFTIALSYRIAYYIAPRLTAGDPFKLTDRTMNLYSMAVTKAAAHAYNEEQIEEEPQAEMIRARE